MVSSLYYVSLKAFGIAAYARRHVDGGLILCYHDVMRERNSAPPGDPGLHLPFSRFAAQMRWLARNYRVVTLREFVRRLKRGRAMGRLAAITFDDGYAGAFLDAWPLLLELGLPATVFVVSGVPGRAARFWWDHPAVAGTRSPERRRQWLTDLEGDSAAILTAVADVDEPGPALPHRPADWDTIARAASAGFDVGVHSATHRTLTRLDDAELDRELRGSWEEVRRRTGTPPAVFAYPYGLWDARVRDAVRAAGYEAAVTLDYGLNGRGSDPWALRRVNVPAGISQPAFQAWAAGLRPKWRAA